MEFCAIWLWITNNPQTVFAGIVAFATVINAILLYILGKRQNELSELQTKIAKEQWRIAVYERRYRIYEIVRDYIKVFFTPGSLSENDVLNFHRNTNEAVFLFEDDINNYIKELFEWGSTFVNRSDNISEDEKGEIGLNSTYSSCLNWFNKQFDRSQKKFMSYLKVEKII